MFILQFEAGGAVKYPW